METTTTTPLAALIAGARRVALAALGAADDATVVVIDARTGDAFVGPRESASRDRHTVRIAAASEGSTLAVGTATPCRSCGALTMLARPGATVRDADGREWAAGGTALDRIVGDHPDFTVLALDGSPARPGYAWATASCAACNGSAVKDARRDERHAAARARIDEMVRIGLAARV